MPDRRLLVLRVGRPAPSGLAALAGVKDPVECRADLILVSLVTETPEEILAACVAAGIRITGSLVERVDARSPGGLALAP